MLTVDQSYVGLHVRLIYCRPINGFWAFYAYAGVQGITAEIYQLPVLIFIARRFVNPGTWLGKASRNKNQPIHIGYIRYTYIVWFFK